MYVGEIGKDQMCKSCVRGIRITGFTGFNRIKHGGQWGGREVVSRVSRVLYSRVSGAYRVAEQSTGEEVGKEGT
jgi:hypothetical protein